MASKSREKTFYHRNHNEGLTFKNRDSKSREWSTLPKL